MQFLSVVAVVLALAWCDLAAPLNRVPTGYAIGAMVGAQSLLAFVAWRASRRWVAWIESGVDELRPLAADLERGRRRWQLIATLMSLGVMIAVDWCHLVHGWQFARVVPLADDLLLLLPVLAPLLVGWAFYFDVERSLVEVYGSRAIARPVPAGRMAYVGGELRRQLGLLLVPLVLLLAMQDVARLVHPDLLDGPHAGVFWLAAGALLFLIFPWTLRAAWATTPLPAGELRGRLEALAVRCRARLSDIRVLSTHGGAANAAVAGPLRNLRYVFLTDTLLARLTDDEIEAVFAHELGHVRHRHLALRLAVGFAPCATWLAARDWLLAQAAAFPLAGIEPGTAVRAALGTNPVDWCALALIVVATACGFLWCSRRWEHEADLFACRLLSWGETGVGSTNCWPGGFGRFAVALERLAAVNGQATDRGGWQHASLDRRIEFLRRAAAWPELADRYALTTRLVGAVLIGLAATGFAAIGWNIVRQVATAM